MTTTEPTAEEIAELIEFCREEMHSRESGDELSYVTAPRRALSIAERLPALLAEWDRLSSELALSRNEVMKAFAERDRLSYKLYASMDGRTDKHGYIEECRLLSAERDRLAGDVAAKDAEIARLTKERDGAIANEAYWHDWAQQVDEHQTNLTAAECDRRLKAEASLATARQTIAELREALRETLEWIIAWGPYFIDDNEWPATRAKIDAALAKAEHLTALYENNAALSAALAKLDAPAVETSEPQPTHPAVVRALFRDAEAGACGAPVWDAPGHTDLMISPEAIDEALAADPLPEELATPDPQADLRATAFEIDYTNWRWERRVRSIKPTGKIFHGSNEWHKEPQWLMEAVDQEDGKTKTFALSGIHAFGGNEPSADLRAALAEAIEIMRPISKWNMGSQAFSVLWPVRNGTFGSAILDAAPIRAFVQQHSKGGDNADV